MPNDTDVPARIRRVLRAHPRGIGVTEIARRAGLNRNAAAKYLELLLVSGYTEMDRVGMAKIYRLSQRVPLSAMLAIRDDLVVILDHAGRIIQVNDAYLTFIGKDRDEVLAMDAEESGLPFVSDPEIAPVFRENGTREGLVREYPDPGDGTVHCFRVRAIPTVFEEGKPGYTVIGEDITAEKESERQLAESEARYRAVVDAEHDLICRFRPDFSVTFMNRSFREYFGAGLRSGEEMDFLNTVSGDDRAEVRTFIGSLDHSGRLGTHEHRVTGRPGGGSTVRWQSWNYNPVYDDSGTIIEIQGNGRDITRERELEEKVQQYIAHMEYLTRTAMEFVDMGEDEDIHRYIAEKLLGLLQCCFVSVTMFDMGEGTSTIKSVATGRENLDYLGKMGIHPVGMTFPIERDLTAEQIVSRKRLVEGPTLYNLMFRLIHEDICAKLERQMNLGCTYVMGIVHQGTIIGSVIIGLQKGRELDCRETLEAFIGQAAVALMRQMSR